MYTLVAEHQQLVRAVLANTTPAYGVTYPFENIPDIATGNIEVYGIECYTAAQIAVTPEGQAVVPSADSVNLSFTLVTTDNNYKQVENQPYYNGIRSLNGGFIIPLNNIRIDLTKCYITVLAAGTLAVNQSALFNLYYRYVNKK